jgi:hypothetical protein
MTPCRPARALLGSRWRHIAGPGTRATELEV